VCKGVITSIRLLEMECTVAAILDGDCLIRPHTAQSPEHFYCSETVGPTSNISLHGYPIAPKGIEVTLETG
jgi:hypothetical protein